MAHLTTLVQFLDKTLDCRPYQDSCQNGLQVESSRAEVLKVGLAVDSGLEVLEGAVQSGCQLLITHHGLFWRDSPQIAGNVGKKVRTLIEGGCSLYSSHLPLDGHPELGNNAQLLRALGASLKSPFCQSGQGFVGYMGELPSPLALEDIEKSLIAITSNERFLALNFGRRTVKTIAVVTGSGSFAIAEAQSLGVDLFITGEPRQSAYHESKELGINVMFAGHYASETFGVKAVGKLLQQNFGIQCEFLDYPTKI